MVFERADGAFSFVGAVYVRRCELDSDIGGVEVCDDGFGDFIVEDV